MHSRTTSRAREPRAITRRAFIAYAGWTTTSLAGLACSWPATARATQGDAVALPVDLLEKSPFVYISPLHRDGRESTCHAELWYAWLDDSVVVTVASDRWKATAINRGLDRARIWVGDHGRWKSWLGFANEEFRKAPYFDAKAERVSDSRMIDRLLGIYEKKYPEEIGQWRDRMRKGNADGSRILIRYRPT